MRLSLSKRNNKIIFWLVSSLTLCAIIFAIATFISLKPVDKPLHEIASDVQTIRVTDRNGQPLSLTYQNRWNSFDHIPLYEIPDLLKTAFILSEDRRFYDHNGIDWQARIAAIRQNILNLRTVRGASTISEQVVRMINPRPRTLWSRWLEGFEAAQLESTLSKADILEFYLNQVPYAANRHGVAQAARYYFNRDLSTLTPKEMLALAVLIRAPSSYDLYKYPGKIEAPILRLAFTMKTVGALTERDYRSIQQEKLNLEPSVLTAEARHFVRHVRLTSPQSNFYRTTLDTTLQKQVQSTIDTRLSALRSKNVHNAAALVADYQTGEILAWVIAGADKSENETPAVEIDTVTTPRQPGSAMKPLLYALTLDKGWTPATILDDSPLTEAIGRGLHNFRNYSNMYYGPISLREALGNSLNIPALLAIRHVGVGEYLTTLQNLGFESLHQSSEIYDEGLALGNGEVTLLEMVQAYAALANKGVYRPFHFLLQQYQIPVSRRIYSEEATSLIGHILSDPSARRLEFGAGSVLNLPVQTAAKTGTSTDYRDAWTMAYNDRYVVGIWMGNLDNTPMQNVTGSTGPALALRSIFSFLNKERETSSLYFSARLLQKDVCVRPEDTATSSCPKRTEWFMPETMPRDSVMNHSVSTIELVRPTEGLQIAYDPRIPAQHQKFRFELNGLKDDQVIEWNLDGAILETGKSHFMLWPIKKGKHVLTVNIRDNNTHRHLMPVNFNVK